MLPSNVADKIEVGDCWHWTGAASHDGYGRVYTERGVKYAHRVVWELLVGPIPEGLVIDHLCRNRSCVNPDHLEPVTRKENQRRGQANQNIAKTHCKRGHEFTEENTYIQPSTGKRGCRRCKRDAMRKYRDTEAAS